MLAISESSMAVLGHVAERTFAAKLMTWIGQQPELAASRGQATASWCQETVNVAGSFGVESEDDVARFARLRLLRGDQWLQSPEAQAVLRSDRAGQLKSFQLECLHWGIAR